MSLNDSPTPTEQTTPPNEEDNNKEPQSSSKTREAPYPKIGDIVRYYELDGGRMDGQELVGKLSLIQPVLGESGATTSWLVEIAELDDVGDGYYAEYPSRKRNKRALKKLEEVSPVLASYVRSEDSFKVPKDADGRVKAYFDRYKLDGYEGPAAIPVNKEVVQTDGERYDELKGQLLRDAAIAGVLGTLVAQFLKGAEDAAIYAAGAAAGVGYLFFLSIKTDTLGSQDAKLGKNISNFRFLLPVIVLIGVSLFNTISSDKDINVFSSVTKEQFASAIIGFLTHRITIFLRQLQPIISESAGSIIPGSAGMAMKLSQDLSNDQQQQPDLFDTDLKTILLVCGPYCTGKTTLVDKLIRESDGTFVKPTPIDRIANGVQFERLESRDEMLSVDDTGRYGLTVDSILSAANPDKKQVVVVDADVDLAKKLTQLAGTRLIGVWVGLDSLEKFEERIRMQIDQGKIKIPMDETKESVMRAKIREVVKDIEYGVVSGIFEFTILNDDLDESLKELKVAAEYCLK